MLAVVVNARAVVLSCIAGGKMLIVIGITDGLPPTALPVSESTALIVTLVEDDEPPVKPVALTVMVMEAPVPPARFVPEVGDEIVT